MHEIMPSIFSHNTIHALFQCKEYQYNDMQNTSLQCG